MDFLFCHCLCQPRNPQRNAEEGKSCGSNRRDFYFWNRRDAHSFCFSGKGGIFVRNAVFKWKRRRFHRRIRGSLCLFRAGAFAICSRRCGKAGKRRKDSDVRRSHTWGNASCGAGDSSCGVRLEPCDHGKISCASPSCRSRYAGKCAFQI